MDPAGNTASISLAYTLNLASDQTPPVIDLLWPEQESLIAAGQFTIRGKLDDETASVVVVDGQTSETIRGVMDRGGFFWVRNLPLDSGMNSFSIIATDAAGNFTTLPLDVERGSLDIQINPVSSLDYSRVQVTGTISDAQNYQVYVNDIEATVYPGGSWTAADVPIIPGKPATFSVRAVPNASGDPQFIEDTQHDEGVKTYVKRYRLHSFGKTSGQTPANYLGETILTRAQDHGGEAERTVWNTYADQFYHHFAWLFPADYWMPTIPGIFESYDEHGGVIDTDEAQVETDIPWETWRARAHWKDDTTYPQEVRRRRIRNARTEVHMRTGGPLESTKENLFVLGALATGYTDPRTAPGEDSPVGPTYAVPPGDLRVLGKRVGRDGLIGAILPDNADVHVTVEAPGHPRIRFDVGPSKHQLKLFANGVELQPDRLVEDAEFCIGQKVVLRMEVVPTVRGFAINLNPTWYLPPQFVNAEVTHIGGDTHRYRLAHPHVRWNVKQVPPVMKTYRAVALPSTVKSTETGAWWISPGPKSTKAYLDIGLRNGQEMRLNRGGLFTVVAPTIVDFRIDYDPGVTWQIHGGDEYELGVFDGRNLQWILDIQRPDRFPGTAIYTQIISRSAEWNTAWGPQNGWKVPRSSNAFRALDHSEEYQGIIRAFTLAAPALRPFPFNDGPAIRDQLYNRIEVSDQFNTYVRWKPDGEDNIYVTIGRIDWQWTGSATRPGSWGAMGPWTVVGAGVPGLAGVVLDWDFRGFPEWMTVYLGIQ